MGTFFVYILKSAICLALFYLFYRLLLSKETFHRFNRIALLGILFLALLVPCIEVTTAQQTEMRQTMLTLEQLLLMVNFSSGEGLAAETGTPANGMTLSGIQIALLVYLAGILFFTFRNLYSLTRLIALLKSGKKETLASGVRLIVHTKEIAPFSWMKYIVISKSDLEENGREILIHETAHIRNRHSVDLLIADICIFFQWFNPAAWLLKQELQNIHEYEADETVIKEGVDAKQYQLLLIKKAVGTRLYSMANSFNHSTLKKRITMMLKEKSSPWARLKYLYVLPLAAVAVAAFARPEISVKTEEISAVKVSDLTAIVETKVTENLSRAVKDSILPSENKLWVTDQKMPEFPGGGKAMKEYIEKNLRYPAQAKEKGVQGRVIVQFTVTKNGKISDPSVVRPVDPELDAEALRLVKSMPDFIPGEQAGKKVDVRYTVPVSFRLDNAEETTSETIKVRKRDADSRPLFIIDGKEAGDMGLETLNPNQIEAISVLKDASATAVYGERGRNGVIVVTLKTEGQLKTEAGNQASTVGERIDALLKQPVQKDKKEITYWLNDSKLTKDKLEGLRLEKGADYEMVAVEADGEQQVKIKSKPLKRVISLSSKTEGKVVDESGEPIPGAIIQVEGTKEGMVTDQNGAFKTENLKGKIIKVEYIDKKTEKVKVEGDKPVIVILKSE